MEQNKSNVSLEELAKYDYVLMIDKSGSMSTNDCPGGKTRWAYAQEQTEAIARQCAEFDSDGIDVVVFAGTAKTYNGVTPDKVTQIFKENSPSGSTETATALESVLSDYRSRKASGNAKPLIVVCVTDGAPNDQKAVDNVIIKHDRDHFRGKCKTVLDWLMMGKTISVLWAANNGVASLPRRLKDLTERGYQISELTQGRSKVWFLTPEQRFYNKNLKP